MCDARARLAQDEEILSDLIEQFCTLNMEEQDRLESHGEDTVECYNGLFDHISVRRRVPLVGETLYNAHDQETHAILTQDMIERLGTELYNCYLKCVHSQHQFDSSHDTVTSLNDKYRDN